MDVELSPQYLRSQEGKSTIGGRLNLRKLEVSWVNTGYFDVTVTPQYREAATYTFDNTPVNIITVGPPTIGEFGTFKCPIYTEGSTAEIHIKNSTPFPTTITSLQWTGMFSQVGRTTK